MRRAVGITISAGSMAAATVLLYTNFPVVAAERGLLPAAFALVVPALLTLAVTHQLVLRRERIVLDRTFWAMWAFLALLLGSTFAAEGYDVALARIGTFASEGLLIYFLVRNAVRTLPDLRVAVAAVVASAALLGGLTLAQSVTGNYQREYLGLAKRSVEHLEDAPPSARADVGLEDRAHGPVDEPNRFAQILLMALPLAFVLVLNAHRGRGTVVCAAAALVLVAAVLVTYSRGDFVTLVGMLVLCVPLGLVRPRHVAAILLAGVVLAPVAVPGYAERVVSIAGVAGLFGQGQVEADGPTRGRTTEMLAALAAYTDHPVLGVGPGQYVPYHSVRYQSLPEISFRSLPTPRRAHSLYLELAAENGTLGLVVFLSIPLLLLRDLWKIRAALARRRPDLARLASGFFLVVAAYLGTGVFLHLAFERYFWFMTALTAAATGVLGAYAPETGPLGRRRIPRVPTLARPPVRRVAT